MGPGVGAGGRGSCCERACSVQAAPRGKAQCTQRRSLCRRLVPVVSRREAACLCIVLCSGNRPTDASEGKGPRRRPQRRLGRRLEEVSKAVGGGYCRLQMPMRLALGVRGTVAGHRLGAFEGGGGTFPPFPCIPAQPPPSPFLSGISMQWHTALPSHNGGAQQQASPHGQGHTLDLAVQIRTRIRCKLGPGAAGTPVKLRHMPPLRWRQQPPPSSWGAPLLSALNS